MAKLTDQELRDWVLAFRARHAQKRREADPFLMPTGNAVVVSFSGGRTSGYMLWRLLQRCDGALPDNVIVAFRNTGMEFEKSLEFVENCSRRWGVRIVWLEYRYLKGLSATEKHSFAVVDFKTASRKGEPFDQIIEARADVKELKDEAPFLPNQGMRYCTGELKQKTLLRYLRSLGIREFHNCIGIRGDEPRRWQKLIDCKGGRMTGETPLSPLFDANIPESEVLEFWKNQPFDLGLLPEESNCTLCFLKSRAKRQRIAASDPSLVEWWAGHEERMGALFRLKEPYRQLVSLPVCSENEEDEEPCHCTD